MAYYMISFDLEDPHTNDYDSIYKSMKKTFPNFCKILSTTCLIKTDSNSREIRKWFKTCTGDENNISVFVARYDDSAYWIAASVIKDIKKLRSD